jgi:hypothetical protein
VCVVDCVCAVQANQKRQTKATPTKPHITDSKTVRPSVRAGAGVCCVRVRFMCGCGLKIGFNA